MAPRVEFRGAIIHCSLYIVHSLPHFHRRACLVEGTEAAEATNNVGGNQNRFGKRVVAGGGLPVDGIVVAVIIFVDSIERHHKAKITNAVGRVIIIIGVVSFW